MSRVMAGVFGMILAVLGWHLVGLTWNSFTGVLLIITGVQFFVGGALEL